MSAYESLASVYDKFTGDVNYTDFANFYEAAFQNRDKKVSRLLDLGCGTGTVTAILAQRGYSLIAVDSSPDMLCLAQEKLSALDLAQPPLLLCQSMTELALHGRVDAAISCLDAVNYLSPAEVPAAFQRLHRHLEPGGLFVFDVHSPARLRALDGLTFVDEDENHLCLWRADFDEDENALFYGLDLFTRRGKLWERRFEEHIEYSHTPGWLIEQLTAAGFSKIEIADKAPQAELGRLFILAENT